MRITTITTIELSSACNMACLYCVNRLMEKTSDRKPAIMSDEVFDRSLFWLKRLVERGSQGEVNLNGNGEPLLDPQIVDRIKQTRRAVGPAVKVQFSSNGVLVTKEIAEALKESGIDEVHLSIHSLYHARRAAHLLMDAGVMMRANFLTLISAHNWAGQLEPEHCIPEGRLPILPCDPLERGRAYIQAEGDVVPCCYDYRNIGRFGSVFDNDLLQRDYGRFSLCDTCHQGKGASHGVR
jgi:hypothetical protein